MLHSAVACHGIPQHSTTCHSIPRNAAACYDIQQNATVCCDIRRHTTVCHDMPHHATAGHRMSRYGTLRFDKIHCSSNVMSGLACCCMPWHAIACHTKTCKHGRT